MSTNTDGSFTIKVGDRFECLMDGNDSTLATYQVATVAANGTVHAFNVKTGKERSFPGYGRMLPTCDHPGGSRADTGEWECSRCGKRFPSYEAWGEATGNNEAVAAVKGAIAAGIARIETE